MQFSETGASADHRLKELTFQAAKGHFGEPVRFLTGVEVELQIVDNEEDAPSPEFLDGARNTLLEYELRDLERTVKTDEDQATLDLWREQVPEFSAQELLNALVYVTLSRPTLRPGARPLGDDYDSVLAHTRAHGGEAALAFRFGKKPYPFSFYDNPGVSEFATLPVRPAQLEGKRRMLTRFIVDEALSYGCALINWELSVSLQTNLSAYHQVETEGGVKWMPVIGRDPSLQSTTADAMAGLNMGVEDGAWFSSILGKVDHNLIGEESFGRQPFTIGVARSNDFRINYQWAENRSRIFQGTDIRQTLLWMIAAISYGLEKGADVIGAMPGRSKPELRPTVITTRTENFDERVDAPLRQMMQSCSIRNGRMRPDPRYVRGAGEEFTLALTGKRLSPRATAIFTNLFIGGLRIGKQGELQVEEAALVAPQLLDDANRKVLAKSAGVPKHEVESLFVSAAILAQRGGFRTRIEDTLHSTANYPPLNPDEWVERMQGSEIFRRAYGEGAAEYAAQLGEQFKKNPYQKR